MDFSKNSGIERVRAFDCIVFETPGTISCTSTFLNHKSSAKKHFDNKKHQRKTDKAITEIESLLQQNEGAIHLSTNDPQKNICYICDTRALSFKNQGQASLKFKKSFERTCTHRYIKC